MAPRAHLVGVVGAAVAIAVTALNPVIAASRSRGEAASSAAQTDTGPVAAASPPTLPEISLPQPGLAGAPTTTETALSSAVPAPMSMPAGASIDEFRSLAAGVIGPTDDVVADLSVFVPTPHGIPSPSDTSITEFSVHIYPYSGGGYSTASITFTSSATPSDLLTFYETTLTAAGHRQTGDTVDNDDLASIRTLTFANPGSLYDYAEIEVSIQDYESETDTDTVRLDITDSATADMLAPFTDWTAGMPIPDGGGLSDAGITVMSTFSSSVSLSANYEYPDFSPTDLEREFEANLPGGGYSLDPDDVEGLTQLAGTDVIYATVYFYDAFPAGATVDLTVTFELGP